MVWHFVGLVPHFVELVWHFVELVWLAELRGIGPALRGIGLALHGIGLASVLANHTLNGTVGDWLDLTVQEQYGVPQAESLVLAWSDLSWSDQCGLEEILGNSGG